VKAREPDRTGPEPHVLCTLASALVHIARARGVDVAALCRGCGIDPAGLDVPDRRMPRSQLEALWQALGDALDDPLLGLHAAEWVPPGNGGVVELVLVSASNAGEAIELCVRYWRLLNEAARVNVAHDDEGLTVEVRMSDGVPMHRHWNDFTLATISSVGRKLGARPFAPRHASVPYPRDRHAAALEALLGCPVRYDAPALGFALRRDDLTTPLLSANPALRQLLAGRADELLATLPPSASFDEQLREAINARLCRSDVAVAEVARALGLSPRSLQRRLQEEGSSFREQVDRCRRAEALRLLGRPELTLTEIAFLLGFSEASAFHRAFRRWYGAPPGEFRSP
jgi:AraC-like DNA-binding protein